MYNLTEHNDLVNKALPGKTFDQALEICQDLEGIELEITEDVYFEKLGCLPPYKWTKSGFLFGAFASVLRTTFFFLLV